MDDQKRLILAIVISVVVLVGYQTFFVKPQDPSTLPQQTQTQSKEQVSEQKSTSSISEYKVETKTQPEVILAPKKDFRIISVSTPLYNISISEHGATVKSLELNNYKETNEKDSPLKNLVPEQLTLGTLALSLKQNSIPELDNAVYTAKIDTTHYTLAAGEQRIEFEFQTSQNIVIKKIFTFKADSYMIDCDVIIQNGSTIPLNDSLVISTPGIYNDEIKSRSRFAFEGPVIYINEEYEAIDPDDIEEQSIYTGNIGWTGYSERYFMTAVMPKNTQDSAAIDAMVELTYANEWVTSNYIQQMERLDPNKQNQHSFTFYMGPKSQKILGQYDNSLKNVVNFGFFNIIAKPLLMGMNIIHGYIPNYGFAIILLTIFIKLVFWPLGTKSYKSMNAMKKLAPLMTELREKHKDDKQRMNKEIMGLYKTYKVNPAGGCLPMLVQMPIFFALYRMLYQAIELRHAPFFGWVTDLSAPDRLFDLGFKIPMMQEPYGIPMLTLLMGASFLLQQKMTPTAGDPMQAKMMMLMPIFMTVIFINFPAGLVLYMFINNIISMGQQYYIQKKFA